MFEKVIFKLSIIKLPSYQYGDSDYKDKMVSRLSCLCNGNHHTWKKVFILKWALGLKVHGGEFTHRSCSALKLSMACFTDTPSPTAAIFQMKWKYHFALMLMEGWRQNFALDTTAVLSCQVQNIVAVKLTGDFMRAKTNFHEIWITMEILFVKWAWLITLWKCWCQVVLFWICVM